MTTAAPEQSIAAELDAPLALSPQQIAQFQQQGFIKLKNVFSAPLLKHYGDEITRQVIALNTLNIPMAERDIYQKAFLQIMNIWTRSEIAKEFVFGKRLAKLAADLLGVSGVRLYHDQALYKEPGGGITPWHADQYYWPLDTDNTITAWVPLQKTPMELGPLAFSATSHRYAVGRNLEISEESETKISKALLEQGLPLVNEPFDLGEVSFHYGWTFHRAGPNVSTTPRAVMTIIYFADGAKLIAPKYKAHENDWNTWMPGTEIGAKVQTHLNPLLYGA